MRYARTLVTAFAVLALGFLGLHLAPGLARAADITELQAGLIVGAVLTWALFRIDSMLYGAQPLAASDFAQED